MDAELIVIGGGASGFFAAITCAASSEKSVLILEKSNHLLQKVKISGGGRCNVTHHHLEAREMSTHYPRGEKSLIGPLHTFGVADTIEWFEGRGVALKTEDDGRMFPTTNDSATIVDALLSAASEAGVRVHTNVGVTAIGNTANGFVVESDNDVSYTAANVLIATGGTRTRSGAKLARALGHELEPAAPSLFTFKINDERLAGLAGLSVENADVAIDDSRLESTGPVLVTHWGLSGPGILKISAWGARELAERNYHFDVVVNWLPGLDPAAVIAEKRNAEPKRQLFSASPFESIPKRLWHRLLHASGVDERDTYAQVGKVAVRELVRQLTNARFSVVGKATNKAEFVTCGGVPRDEINFKTMESKLVSGLYFAGEVVDVDGITGGYNFQHCWTSGYLAGSHIAAC